MFEDLLPLDLVLWLLPCAIQDYRHRRVANWLTVRRKASLPAAVAFYVGALVAALAAAMRIDGWV